MLKAEMARRLRLDARRNRERLLDAARDAFAAARRIACRRWFRCERDAGRHGLGEYDEIVTIVPYYRALKEFLERLRSNTDE
jgi:hypothetical protein